MMSDNSGPYTYFSGASHLPSSSATSNPRPMDTWSVFGDDSCGEPLYPQHVVIDFTPNDDDSDIVQKKVCSFWQFINSHPEIQNLKVEPESDRDLYTGDSNTGIATVSVKPSAKVNIVKKNPDEQVLDMLEFAREKKMINTALNAKLRQSVNSLGSHDYQQSEIITQPKTQEKIKHVCKCIPCRNSNCRRNKKALSDSRDKLSPMREVNRKLNEWDAKHPKSMEPPGHIPPLQHCLIQRQMFPKPS